MTENDIKGYIGVLSGVLFAPDADQDAECAGKTALLELASVALVDLHRIADALEILATSKLKETS